MSIRAGGKPGTVRRYDRMAWIEHCVRAAGPFTAAEVQERWRIACQESRMRKPVTIDSIQRDLNLLVQQKKLVQVRSDKGHEMGGGRWVAYRAYKAAE